MIGPIHSIIIWTDDVSRLAPFYRDKLGLTVETDGEEFTVFAPPTPGAAQVCVGRHSEVAGRTSEPNRIMLNFLVPDCRAAYDDLRARGVVFSREPSVDEADGFILATFQDPDGNTLQLVQPPA